MTGEAELTFRPLTAEDLPIIMDSWAESFRSGVRSHAAISPEEFHSFHRPNRERFFSKGNVTCIIAANPEDPWHVIGWIAVESIPSGLILHYLYVKGSYRKRGIAMQLLKRGLPTAPVFYTHLTNRAAKIIAKKQDVFREWKFIPHLF